MSEKIVNALARMKEIYVEEVSHKNLIQQKIDEEAKQIKKYKEPEPEPELDPVGKENPDIDNDGDIDKTDSYLLNRRKVRSDAIEDDEPDEEEDKDEKPKKKKSVKENSYYSWRDTIDEQTLLELVEPEKQNHIKEKKVDNYAGKEPVVTINPEVKTESVLLDSEELDENFIQESIDIATQYFYEQGLSLYEMESIIEEVGVEEFSEWVLSFGYDNIELIERKLRPEETALSAKTRERITGKSVSRKNVADLKGGAATTKTRSDEARRQARAAARQESGPTERQKRLATLLAKQKDKQTTSSTKNPPISQVKRTFGADLKDMGNLISRGVLAGLEGHKKAMREKEAGGSIGKQLRKGLGAAVSSFAKKGTAQFKEWVEDLLQEGYDLSSYTWDELYEEYEELQEKAVSEQQQKLFGLALSVKRGETSRDKVSKEVLKIVDTVPEAEIRKFAGTPHKRIPEKTGELAEKVIQFVRENY
jgi:hypothetical protein